MENNEKQWGLLRETAKKAAKAGKDKDTGVCRTGLEDYLKVIFPDVDDWIHDNIIDTLPKGIKTKKRPDYRSETLKLIIEFDGVQHFKSPKQIRTDVESTKFYEGLGYTVVRIPYFIQLSKDAVEKLFGIKCQEALFDERIPSLGLNGNNTPAYLCPAGIERMAKEFHRFPNQYKTNLEHLKKCNDPYLTGVDILEKAYQSYCK